MSDDYQPAAQKEVLSSIRALIERYGQRTPGTTTTAEEAARAWIAADFADAEEVDDWLRAGCDRPEVARALEEAGITPAQAGLRTSAGAGEDEDTIACKLTRGDLSMDEARRLITSHFWN